MQLLWQGSIPLASVTWRVTQNSTHSQFPEYKETRLKIWEEKIAHYPQIYDGDILFVEHCIINSHSIHFEVSTIKYSLITTLFEYQKSFPGWYGSLGCQVLLYNFNHTALLIGQRAMKSDYKPGFYAPPGGIFEKSDLISPPVNAVMREIHEETSVTIKENDLVLKALLREDNKLCLIFIVEGVIPEEIDVSGNEEWENHKLKWIILQDLPLLGQNVLECIKYLQNQI